MYFSDIRALGDDVLVLLSTEVGQSAAILVLGPGGENRGRIDVLSAGGANRMVYDATGKRLILATPDDAQIVSAPLDWEKGLPGGADAG